MIGKPIKRRRDGKSSFKKLVKYATNPEKAEYLGFQNVQSIETAALEMEALASDNKRCKDPAFHFVLSWREFENPTEEQIEEAVKIALGELDLQNCQAVWGLQTDTENKHLHVAVNKIDPETLKAIQPANNFTFFALERASRKIEIEQGWEIEQTGHYKVTEDGRIVEKGKHDKSAPPLSPGAQDSEAHTAVKSAERIGQEIAAPIIRTAQSWDELHIKLAEQGISFEKKGSGAVLKIGGTVIKASVAGRDISLTKLVHRLGDYLQASHDVHITHKKAEPVEKISPEIYGTWEEYQEKKADYFTSKNKHFSALKDNHKNEILELAKRHKDERAAIFSKNWRGKGQELNIIRSVVSAQQKKEKLNLRDNQRDELEVFKDNFPRTFPNFKTWLQGDEQLTLSFRYPKEQPAMFSDGAKTELKVQDLRGFNAVISQKRVAYTRDNNKNADFLDYGRRIVLAEKYDSAAVLAALQLASQKWGSVSLKGSDEYKRMCVEIAVKNNIKIENKMITENKAKKENTIDTENAAMLFNKYAEAVGASKFRIVVTEFQPEGGVQAFVMDKEKDGKTAEDVLKSVPKLNIYASKYNKNINVVPLSSDKHHLLVDDVTPDNLVRLREDGYKPACVIESSPKNYQVILNVKHLDNDDRDAANKLTKDLNIKYGDPKLSGAVHAHRLPPFPNLKPKHQREDGTYPQTKLVESIGGYCEKAFEQLKESREWLRHKESENKTLLKSEQPTSSWQIGAKDHNGAYWLHCKDIISKQKGELDYSRIDAMIGVRMRITGYSPSQVQSAIEENASAMRKENMTESAYNEKYRNRDWHRFAKETTKKFVFGVRGTIQHGKAEQYRPLYMKLEGRSIANETKQFHEMDQKLKNIQEREGNER